MEKLIMKSKDLIKENIKSIGKLFPNVITETKDVSGNIKYAIDFELLKQELSDEIIEGNKERYTINWPGKKEAILQSNTPIDKTLRPVKEESSNWENTKNIYIEGDNLEVLKLLQESYLNKVKCIYIDPPYNTGKDFVYRDNFTQDKDEYGEESGQVDEEGNKLFQNTEYHGRYHSNWLTMMYSRLKLSKNLLSEDGIIFISIDDNEVHNLRKICDELFGERNFVGGITWQTATDNNPSQISIEHEYIVCYAKNMIYQEPWLIKSEKAKYITKKYDELREEHGNNLGIVQKELKRWIKDTIRLNKIDLAGISHYSYVDNKGVYYPGNSANTRPGGYDFNIIHPITGKICKKPSNGYRWPKNTFDIADSMGDIEWGEDETTIPKIKKRIETATELLKSYYYEDNRKSSSYFNNLMGGKIFDNPKSLELMKRLLKFTSLKDSVILDFFSGSGTTAHAVMQLNAEDGGNRRYIMVQLPEKTDEKSEAFKAGYKNIAEIGKERIRRAAKKIKEETNAHIDYGFRVYKVDSSNMKDVYYLPDELEQKFLDDLESNIKEDRTGLDLLTQVILESGLELSLSTYTKIIKEKEVYFVDENSLIACFEEKIDEELIKEIAKRRPSTAIFRDNSFKNSANRINLEEIFKSLSPNTKIKVL
ncbi:site-specific DNA-methyltransferase [Tissierella creatinophila]|uniref:Putative methyltransferase n=1 Tax=Tissierella creatinophila DSM 6911 TaxID=1123403 RepID=A0A1U7M3R7_TISCR|nr:site-specific DNA-methyltransferase [Tissierella creatinophila]OLS01859.1 putative methyltransferase [Tissierella creatinophila DSM 6911]